MAGRGWVIYIITKYMYLYGHVLVLCWAQLTRPCLLLPRCAVLHSGRSQDQREAHIKGFRDDTYNILIATDVAGG